MGISGVADEREISRLILEVEKEQHANHSPSWIVADLHVRVVMPTHRSAYSDHLTRTRDLNSVTLDSTLGSLGDELVNGVFSLFC